MGIASDAEVSSEIQGQGFTRHPVRVNGLTAEDAWGDKVGWEGGWVEREGGLRRCFIGCVEWMGSVGGWVDKVG